MTVREVTLSDYPAIAYGLDFPTEGEFAGELWQLCSSIHGLPYDVAADLYRACGYIPFSGYPLTRPGRLTLGSFPLP